MTSNLFRPAMIGVCFITAIMLGIIGYNMSLPAPAPVVQAVQPIPAPSYLVAAHRLGRGTLARDEDFTSRPIPAGQIPQGAFQDTPESRSSLRGALVREFVDVGAPVTDADVVRPRDRGFIASVLQPGNRAVSIGVDPVSGVSGLIWPGDHVDVVLTQPVDKDNKGHTASETVLRNVRIIAIDQEIVQGPTENAAGKLVKTVTVEVSSKNVETIAVAAQLGKLSLAIRSAEERPEVANVATTFGSDVSPVLAQPRTVTVIQGKDRTDYTFNGGKNEQH